MGLSYILKKKNGLGIPVVADSRTKSVFSFYQWDLTPIQYKQVEVIETYDSVMTFLVPYGYVYSHVVAHMLPKLNFTCGFLVARQDIKILLPSHLSMKLLCMVCPQLCRSIHIENEINNSSNPNGRFILVKDEDEKAISAKTLYYPVLICDDCTENSINDRGNDVGSNPHGVIPLLSPKRGDDDNDKESMQSSSSLSLFDQKHEHLHANRNNSAIQRMRYLVYMRREHVSYRMMDPNTERTLLEAICSMLAFRSGIQLVIFKSKGDFLKDIETPATTLSSSDYLKEAEAAALSSSSSLPSTTFTNISMPKDGRILYNARIMLGIHGGSLTNMIFTQPDTVIFEIANLEGNEMERANFFHACLASAVGLEHHAIKPINFNMWRLNPRVTVDVNVVIETIKKYIPEIAKNVPDVDNNPLDKVHHKRCLRRWAHLHPNKK